VGAGERRSFIGVVAEADDFADGLLQRGPIEVGGRVVDRISAEHDEGFDRLGGNRLREVGDSGGLLRRDFDKIDRASDVPEGSVDSVSDRVNGSRLVGTGNPPSRRVSGETKKALAAGSRDRTALVLPREQIGTGPLRYPGPA
jgi:hypothetical protein